MLVTHSWRNAIMRVESTPASNGLSLCCQSKQPKSREPQSGTCAKSPKLVSFAARRNKLAAIVALLLRFETMRPTIRREALPLGIDHECIQVMLFRKRQSLIRTQYEDDLPGYDTQLSRRSDHRH